MKFKEIPYQRLDMEQLEADWFNYLNQLESARSWEEAFVALLKLEAPQRMFSTISVLSEIRHTMDTNNQFYRDEEAYLNMIKPRYQELINCRNLDLLKSPFRQELKNLLGDQLYSRIELKRQCFSKAILEDLKLENKLSADFTLLTANIEGRDGDQLYSIAELERLTNSEDRTTRKKYTKIAEEAYATIAEQLDRLYDDLVQVRHTIAGKLGRDSFTDLGYARMERTGYNRDDLLLFRKEVEDELVPVVNDIFIRQKERLGVDALYNYDEGINFSDGNIVPKVGLTELLTVFNEIFAQLSPESKLFYQDLLDGQFYDLDLRKGKINGAYSNYLPLFHRPFIFASYNKTPAAIKTFAHECGHGLYSYLMRGETLIENTNCSADLAEIHAMTMEFFIWPWLDRLFVEKDIRKYKYYQIKQALSFIPYGTAVDEFQHRVYDHPEMTPKERRVVWQELEERYLPWRNYDGEGFFSQGRIWQRQTHIYKWPFYYIDYVLAQSCALQYHFFRELQPDQALSSYLQLLKLSSRHSFCDAITLAGGINSPLTKGVVGSLAADAKEFLVLLEL